MNAYSGAANAAEPTTLPRGRTLALTGAGLTLIAVCYGFARFAYGLFVPLFRDTFGIDAATAGAIASTAYGAYCVSIVLAAILTPRWGARATAVLAGTVATAGTALIAAAPDTLALAAGVVVAGSSTGIASPPLAHAIARSVAAARRERAQAVVNAGTGVGVMVAGPIALLAHDGWRLAWLSFAVICAATTIAVALTVPSERRRTDVAAPRAGRDADAVGMRTLRDRGGGRLVLAAATMGAASAATWTFGRELLVTAGGMSETASTVAWILLGGLGVLGAVAGDLVTRLGTGRAWALLALSLASATALLAIAPGQVILAGAASAVFGAAYIAGTGVLLLWGTELLPERPAAGVGLGFFVLAVGQAAGAVLLGVLADAASLPIAFAVAALVGGAGALIRPAPHGPGTAVSVARVVRR